MRKGLNVQEVGLAMFLESTLDAEQASGKNALA